LHIKPSNHIKMYTLKPRLSGLDRTGPVPDKPDLQVFHVVNPCKYRNTTIKQFYLQETTIVLIN